MDFSLATQVEYRNEPGDKKLNYIRVRVIGGDGMGLGVGVSTSWPGGAVRCPGDIAPKGDGWCEFTATEGEFTVTLDGRGQPVTVTLPKTTNTRSRPWCGGGCGREQETGVRGQETATV
jgi:hypothetical protein